MPEVGPFFESMMMKDPEKRFSARQALEAFRQIRSQLSPAQLNHVPVGRFWKEGLSFYFIHIDIVVEASSSGRVQLKDQFR